MIHTGIADILRAVLTETGLSTIRDGLKIAYTSLGHFVLAVDPTLFMTLEAFSSRLQTFNDGFARPSKTYAAGGPE